MLRPLKVCIHSRLQTRPRPGHSRLSTWRNIVISNLYIHIDESTTPPGSPPPNLMASLSAKPAFGAPNSILEALANIARQNTATPSSTSNLPPPTASYSMPPARMPQPVSSALPHNQSHVSYPQTSQPVNVPSLPFTLPQMPGQSAIPGAIPNNPSNPALPFGAAMPGVPGAAPAGPGLDPTVQQQILLIKALADQGVPFDKIPALIQGMTSGGASSVPPPHPSVPAAQNPYASGQPWVPPPSVKLENSRDRSYQDGRRSPPRYQVRSRSRSPDRGWSARDSPRGRDKLDYGHKSPARGHYDDRRGGEYRQRSPAGRYDRSPSASHDYPPPSEKWIDFDPKLTPGSIKVLSRTLFVGGVT